MSAPHPLHAATRAWPETNCYLDLWIELLHARGRDPLPLLGLALAMDWEADHFTFLKPDAGMVFELCGAVLHELALFDALSPQLQRQLARGAVPLLEVDAFFLPDTRGTAYRERHSKTTIAVLALDPAARRMEYLHNAGRFTLQGEDHEGLLAPTPLPPFAELVRFSAAEPAPADQRNAARALLRRHAATRAGADPVAAFAAALPGLMAGCAGDPQAIHALCFNTARQIGAAFGLLADHLAWLGQDPAPAAALADQAKVLQFQISRAARRGRDDPALGTTLEAMRGSWHGAVAAALG